jgi:isopenicillin-N epimerase
VLLDHVTSQTGLVFPLAEIVPQLAARGVEVLVDGAHAPGMIPLNLDQLGATYYTGNCHKWLGAPKGAGFLYVQQQRQRDIRPLIISHGANSQRTDRSQFLIEFGWTGTSDVSAYLSVPEALRFMGELLPGGWPEVMERNRNLALQARRVLCEALGEPEPCPPEMIGSLAAFPIPDATDNAPSKSPLYLDPLQEQLFRDHRVEVPIIPWPAPPKRLMRISAQLYNHYDQYRFLANVLTRALG